jgi:hypothetical protein
MEKSYPAGRQDWAWRWMGLNPPNLCYNNKPIDERFNRFSHCFGAYYGIGDFDYWKREPLAELPYNDKVELIHLLLEEPENKKMSYRKYLGFLPNGKLNNSIDPHADADDFYEKLTLAQCRRTEYPHNNRTRHVVGYVCRDCGGTFLNNSEDYIRTEGLSNCWFKLHNFKVSYHRAGQPVPAIADELMVEYDEMKKTNPFEIRLEDIVHLINRVDELTREN